MSMQPASKFVARKRQGRGERRVAEIVASAARLFAERGFDGTSMNAIAQSSGMTIGSLYQYFPNREAIVDAVAAQYLREWHAHTEQTRATFRPTTLRQLMIEGLTAFFDFHTQHAGIKAFLDADPKRAASIRTLRETVDVGIELLTMFFPNADYDEIARVTFICTTLINGAAAMLPSIGEAIEHDAYVLEIAAAIDAYVVSKLGEPTEPAAP